MWQLLKIIVFLLAMTVFVWNSEAKTSKKELEEKMGQLPVFPGKPNRPHEIIQRLRYESTKVHTPENLLSVLKKKAVKKGADAIMDLKCGSGQDYVPIAIPDFGAVGKQRLSFCQGTAIRWK